MTESNYNLRLKRQLQQIRHQAAEPVSRRFDWQSVRKQIEASWISLSTLDNDTPEALAQLWQQRAAQLAQIPVPEATGELLLLIVIRLGRELYGLEVQYVRDVALVRTITRVPRVPPWVAGLVVQRGHIISAIDLQRFMGVEAAPRGDELPPGSQLVNIQTADMEIALLVDEVLGLDVIPIDQLHPIESAPHGFRIDLVRGAVQHSTVRADDLVIVLSVPALLADERLIVNEVV
jgi:purine-binding chemotaxis protein CheW